MDLEWSLMVSGERVSTSSEESHLSIPRNILFGNSELLFFSDLKFEWAEKMQNIGLQVMMIFRNLTIEWILWLSFSVCRIYVHHQYCCLLLSCFFNEMIFSKILRAKYCIVNMLESCMIFNNSFFALGLHPVIYLANRWTFFWWSLWMPWKTAALTLVLNTSMLIPFPLWCSEIGSFFAIKCFILWWNICRTQSWIPLLRIIIKKICN